MPIALYKLRVLFFSILYSCYVVRCPHSINFDWQTRSGRYLNYYTYGVAMAQVEVDCLTGNYTVVIYLFKAEIILEIMPAISITRTKYFYRSSKLG